MNLSFLHPAPDFLTTPASRRAYALNVGFRRLAGEDFSSPNYVAWLENRAAQFAQDVSYGIEVCNCAHSDILEEASFRGAPLFYCLECRHLVRFGFTGRAVHCEKGR